MANYLTVAEYVNAPTGIDVNNLVTVGGQPGQTAALQTAISKASGWIDNECNQPLVAGSFTELLRARYSRDGSISVHPRQSPLNQLLAVSIGSNASDMFTVASLASSFIDQQQYVLPFSAGALGWPFSLGGGSKFGKLLISLTSVSGWPNTVLTSAPAAGATSFTVATAAGFTPQLGSPCVDQVFTIYDGASTEVVNVTSVAGATVNCTALAFSHTVGVCVSGLPADIKGVAVTVTSAYLRERSSESIVMQNTLQPVGQQSGWDAPRSAALQSARQTLSSYQRVR